MAVECFRPIDPDGMAPAYKRAFEETKRGCKRAIEELRVEARKS